MQKVKNLFFCILFLSGNYTYAVLNNFADVEAPVKLSELILKQGLVTFEWLKNPVMREVDNLGIILSVPDSSLAWGAVIKNEAQHVRVEARQWYINNRRDQIIAGFYKSYPDLPEIGFAASICSYTLSALGVPQRHPASAILVPIGVVIFSLPLFGINTEPQAEE